MVLQVQNLCKEYPQFSLRDISFQLPEGAIMGLIGENGAGKSTTMRMILGMAQPDSGQISVFGHRGVTPQDRESIGVVFDEMPFNQTLYTSHLGRVMKKIYSQWDESAYNQYLQRFSLPDKKEIKDFSRGMKMKLSLAIALSHGAEMLDIFLEFISDGKRSILVSSHITSDLEQIADYITFIHQGRLLMSKNKDELLYGYAIAKADCQTLHAVDSKLVEVMQDTPYGSQALVNDREQFARRYPDILLDSLTLDEMMLMLCRNKQ